MEKQTMIFIFCLLIISIVVGLDIYDYYLINKRLKVLEDSSVQGYKMRIIERFVKLENEIDKLRKDLLEKKENI